MNWFAGLRFVIQFTNQNRRKDGWINLYKNLGYVFVRKKVAQYIILHILNSCDGYEPYPRLQWSCHEIRVWCFLLAEEGWYYCYLFVQPSVDYNTTTSPYGNYRHSTGGEVLIAFCPGQQLQKYQLLGYGKTELFPNIYLLTWGTERSAYVEREWATKGCTLVWLIKESMYDLLWNTNSARV